jgi:hypothetical protein
MKKSIYLFNLLLSLTLLGQSHSLEIEWNTDGKLHYDSYSIVAPNFKTTEFYYNEPDQTIHFFKKIKVESRINESSIQIENITFETISNDEIGVLDKNKISTTPNLKLVNTNEKLFNEVLVSFSPIINQNGTYRKIKSIRFSYNFESGRLPGPIISSDFDGVRNSVLSTGNWFRFHVEKSGVYRINRSFLQQLGMNINFDPRTLKIYGNGGRMVPLLNSIPYPADLEEVAIQFIGEADGTFNNEDFILFYAEGVDQWSEENRTNLNLYENKSYYYVTFGGTQGKRMETITEPEGIPNLTLTTFNDYQFHERDLVNIGRLGRKWFGETFSAQNSQSFQFSLPNVVTSEPIQIRVEGAAEASITTTMSVNVNGQNLGSLNLLGVNPNSGTLFWDSDVTFTTNGSENLTVQITYNNGGIPTARGFLNYINIRSVRNLRGFGKQFMFTNNSVSSQIGIGEYQITNANNISQVWEITDRFNPSFKANNNQQTFSLKSALGTARTFIAIDPSDYFTPLRDNTSRVNNQNLKGSIFKDNSGQFRDIDYLIVTPAFLNSEAERLAVFHRNYSNLNVKVVNLEQIYHEFASGKQDIGAIRNFVKYVYKNASQPDKRVKYLNMFGDASFDFKDRIQNNTNIVPIYHTVNSNNLSASQMSDDFFTMMDDNEGTMNTSVHKMDIAVGRMLVSNLQQAREMVNKVIEYHDEKSYGRWRNNFTLISDDVDESWEAVIQSQLDQLGNTIGSEIPTVNVYKIHSDAFIQEVSSGGQRYPRVREEILNAFERGSLVFNYFGHGGEDILAKERIYERSDAQNLNNRFKYPLFVTVTCEFTRFDNPFRPTAGEFTYWNPRGGAVSLLTTTRRIDVTTGQNINSSFAGNLYGYGANAQADISIAEALRISKNQYPSQTLMVFYVGDPALKLAIPKPSVVLTQINGVPITESDFVFNALSPVTLKGEVRNENNNQIISNFNGELAIQIFDKNIQRATLGNDNITNNLGQLILMNFFTLGETIFRGNASINNGQFEFNFIVPRDITIPVGNGRISFYAKRNQPLLEDRAGYNTDILIGGINANAAVDIIGPRVRLYMNDETFVNGGITDRNPIFLAFLEDESGINTASGIGHDIIAILDGDETNPYILNDYYETELDDFTKGKVTYPFRNLEPGLHTITFRAWDVYNNPVTAELQFYVTEDNTVVLKNVLNYPNPFVSYTQFWFTHNRPFEPLDVQVQIMTITGKIVKTINQSVTTDGFLSREISWDGRDDFGDRIGKGVYVYKLTVKSTLSNKRAEKIEKLVIL